MAFRFFFLVPPMFDNLSLEPSSSVCNHANVLFCFLLYVTVVQPSLSSSWAPRSYASPLATLERFSSTGKRL